MHIGRGAGGRGPRGVLQLVEGNGKQALKLRMNSALNMSRLLFWPISTRTFIKWEESERDLWFLFADLFEAAVILHYEYKGFRKHVMFAHVEYELSG